MDCAHVFGQFSAGAPKQKKVKNTNTAKRHSPSDQHGVQDDAQRPHVRRFARVRRVDAQYFGRHVRRTAALVLQQILGRVLQDDGVFERLEPQVGAAVGGGENKSNPITG